jgi:hypothetical protein
MAKGGVLTRHEVCHFCVCLFFLWVGDGELLLIGGMFGR